MTDCIYAFCASSLLFFFSSRRRHTRSLCDWSSDVCSSDLLYYARDENQFLRRRRTLVFALFPDLVQTRFKDAGLPWQRGVLLLALLLVAVRKLSEWLTSEGLLFQFLFVDQGQEDPLAPERDLLKMLLRERIA